MKCPGYVRLRLLYEAAFQHWGHTLLSPEGTELLAACQLVGLRRLSRRHPVLHPLH
jgi:hypothetical protein